MQDHKGKEAGLETAPAARRGRVSHRWLVGLHALVAVGLLGAGIARGLRSESVAPVERRAVGTMQPVFHALTTLEYRDATGRCRIQQEGALAMDRATTTADGMVGYVFGYETLGNVDGSGKGMAASLDGAVLWREPEADRFAGGDPAMRTVAVLANAALDQLTSRFIADGSEQVFRFRYPDNAPLMPPEMTFRIKGRRHAAVAGDVLTVTALSDPFALRLPDARNIQARYRVFCVMDPTMEIAYLQASRFEAVLQGGQLVHENLLVLREDDALVDLRDFADSVEEGFAAIGLSTERETASVSPTTAVPAWAPQALVGGNVSGVLAAAAIEGRPNFAITATIGAVLLADAGFSIGTTLLKEAGVIDWSWRGIPHEAGQLLGRSVATGYNMAAGREAVNVDWAGDTAGLAGDLLSLCLPEKALMRGATVSLKAGKKALQLRAVPKSIDLAGKSLRVSRRGLEIVRLGRYGAAARRYRTGMQVLKGVQAVRTGLRAETYTRNWYRPVRDLPPPRIGDVSFRLYWIPPRHDMDLHVRDPAGNTISFSNKESSTGGRLDRDDRTSGGPENVFWPRGKAPSGTYECWAEYYAGDGPHRAVLEIREGHRVVETRTFVLRRKGDKTDVLKWTVNR